jgi:hypothetical protein
VRTALSSTTMISARDLPSMTRGCHSTSSILPSLSATELALLDIEAISSESSWTDVLFSYLHSLKQDTTHTMKYSEGVTGVLDQSPGALSSNTVSACR